ncbi:MAG TPA: cytochrome c [Bryobacteraceae bacterium]|nr:cytochrome c [Bryobacteraceae bacterium]
MTRVSLCKQALGLFSILTCFSLIGAAQEAKTIKPVPPRPSVSIDGKVLFKQYCAVCHGIDGKGSGPAASALKQQPTDLTRISKRNQGKFPEDRILRVLQGQETIASHGTADMPVWGVILYQMNTNPSTGQIQIHSLLRYLEGLQIK